MDRFKVGDIAHITNKIRVRGIIHPEAETEEASGIKNFILKEDDALTITKVYPSKDVYSGKETGGAVYDAVFEHDGTSYHIDSIPQRAFWSKAGWERYMELVKQMKQVEKGCKTDR